MIKMVDKRMKKFEGLKDEVEEPDNREGKPET